MDTMILSFSVCPSDRVQLSTERRSDHTASEMGNTYPCVCHFDDLKPISRSVHQEIADAFSVIGSGQSDFDLLAGRGHLESIRKWGISLLELLLPDEVITWLRRLGQDTHVIFRCDPLLNGVPFECMFLWDDFLVFTYAAGRQLLSSRSKDRLFICSHPAPPYYCESIVDPGGSLPRSVCEEFEYFLEAWVKEGTDELNFNSPRISHQLTIEDLRNAVRHSQIVTFVCHYDYKPGVPEESGYLLSKPGGSREVFSAREMLNTIDAGHVPPHLMLSLCCESGITHGWESSWPEDCRVYGMVDAALRVGVRHYIGTLSKIPGPGSVKVLQPFYLALGHGSSVGESLRQARRAFRKEFRNPLDGGTLLGLSFLLYGDPTTTYVTKRDLEEPNSTMDAQTVTHSIGSLDPAKLRGEHGGQQTRRGSSATDETHAGKNGTRCEDHGAVPASGGEAWGLLVLLSHSDPPRIYEMLHSWFVVGRNADCHISLASNEVSDLHATFARTSLGFVVVDRHSKNGTFADGQAVCQHILSNESVVRIGDYWMLFDLSVSPVHHRLGRSLSGTVGRAGTTVPSLGIEPAWLEKTDKESDSDCPCVHIQCSTGQCWTTSCRPVVVGSHPYCSLCFDGAQAEDFHAMFSWKAPLACGQSGRDAGFFVESLQNRSPVLVNGKSTSFAQLAHGDTIRIGTERITVRFQGDVPSRAMKLSSMGALRQGLLLTCISGASFGVGIDLDNTDKRWSIGRDPALDLVLDNATVSSTHAELWLDTSSSRSTGRSCYVIMDCGSQNGTSVNGHKLRSQVPHPIEPGDVIQLSQGQDCCDLLLCYGASKE